jgi:hypothetical protein
LAAVVDGHEHDLGFGHLDSLAMARGAWADGRRAPPLGLDRHAHGNRRAPDPKRLGVEAHDIAEEHRLVELDLAHRLRHVPVRGDLARFHRRRQVDVRQDHPAEDRPHGVGVLRQQDHFDGGHALSHAIRHFISVSPGISFIMLTT